MKEETIELKAVTRGDCRDLWKWRNHPDVRRNFFDDNPVPWKRHKDWFYSKIKDENTRIYIALKSKDKIGVIRFEIKDKFVSTSVNLNPLFFGRGLGWKIIELGSEKFFQETGAGKPIVAEIKRNNIASQKAFTKAGYEFIEEAKEKLIYKKEVVHV